MINHPTWILVDRINQRSHVTKITEVKRNVTHFTGWKFNHNFISIVIGSSSSDIKTHLQLHKLNVMFTSIFHQLSAHGRDFLALFHLQWTLWLFLKRKNKQFEKKSSSSLISWFCFFFQQISVGIEDDAGCSICPGDSASVCLFLFCFYGHRARDPTWTEWLSQRGSKWNSKVTPCRISLAQF